MGILLAFSFLTAFPPFAPNDASSLLKFSSGILLSATAASSLFNKRVACCVELFCCVEEGGECFAYILLLLSARLVFLELELERRRRRERANRCFFEVSDEPSLCCSVV